jgi:hypothetical protein
MIKFLKKIFLRKKNNTTFLNHFITECDLENRLIELSKSTLLKKSKLNKLTIYTLQQSNISTIYDIISKSALEMFALKGVKNKRFIEIYFYIKTHWKITDLWYEKNWHKIKINNNNVYYNEDFR